MEKKLQEIQCLAVACTAMQAIRETFDSKDAQSEEICHAANLLEEVMMDRIGYLAESEAELN